MQKNYYLVPALFITIGIIISAGIGAYTFYSTKKLDNTLSVTGSAKTAVTSDSAKWNIQIVRKVYESGMQSGYSLLTKDVQEVVNFLKTNNISEEKIKISTIYPEEIYKYNQNDTGPREFNLRQSINVISDDVNLIDKLSKSISVLVNKGVFVSGNDVQFFISKLPELRVSLLADSIKDAKARAEQIAGSNAQSVGSLKAASSGVIQVLAPNSIEISDYGQYDTQSLEKEVMVTVRATFFLK